MQHQQTRGKTKPTKLNRRGRGNAQQFWNREYARGEYLALSTNPSEDMVKFTRWMERELGKKFLNPTASVLDLGCGNGRNILYLGNTYGMHGTGIDISNEAIAQARKNTKHLDTKYFVETLEKPLPVPDASQTIVLDMMVSHVLDAEHRKKLLDEILRVLRTDGWLFMKTFLAEGDEHARRLLRDNPSSEHGTYIHPIMGTSEHVYTEKELEDFLSPHFYIHAMIPSHQHKHHGGASAKRRSVTIYAQKN